MNLEKSIAYDNIGGNNNGVRLTGISTPIGGISWEYKDAEEQVDVSTFCSKQKIRVFISSVCGIPKYDKIREELVETIKKTNLAEVYAFEKENASSLNAGPHYKWALEDSDLCIFLIDNKDGVSSGVQEELEIVKKHNIKALYYFCDENEKEKTALEKSLLGVKYAKIKTVHSFDELGKEGAQALIDDILSIYHYYCRGKLVPINEVEEEVQSIELTTIEKYQHPTIPKATLKSVDKCKKYLLRFAMGNSYFSSASDDNTSNFDDWGLKFLSILFEGNSIKSFNISMYLEMLEKYQSKDYYKVVQNRWKAIQSHFDGDVEKCLKYLNDALGVAKETSQPSWVIKDILIDIRNEHHTNCIIKNEYTETFAQNELTNSDEELYYPILDRILESLNEKYISGLFDSKIKSPYSVTIGNNFDQFGEMLAGILIVSMYNGSLTHLLLLYDRIQDFLFYLCSKYDDCNFRLNLFKLVIFSRKVSDIKGIQNSYPEVLNYMTSEDAKSIINFCNNYPIPYQSMACKLISFGTIGYYLEDDEFKKYESKIIRIIDCWINDDNSIVALGQYIFKCLSGVALRLSQDKLANICCQFIRKQYRRWYNELFTFIAKYIDLNKMSSESAKEFIASIELLLSRDSDREEIRINPTFLCILRKQNHDLTETLDKLVAQHLPHYFKGTYMVETADISELDISSVLNDYIEKIRINNEKQGKNGVFYGRAINEISTIRALLLTDNFIGSSKIMDSLICTICNTILTSMESNSFKLDAISLLMCIIIKFPDDFKRNIDEYEKLFIERETLQSSTCSIMSSNIDDMALEIGMLILYAIMGKQVSVELLELMTYIQDDVATTLAVNKLIVEYLEVSEDVNLPSQVDSIILQNVIQWLRSEYLDVRWYATRVLLMMARKPENRDIVNHQIIKLVDSDNLYIKNLILQNLNQDNKIDDKTKEYIIAKCKNDNNYVTKMVCAEIEKNNKN